MRSKLKVTGINKNRSCLDENEAFLTTADSPVKLLERSTKPVKGWKGIEYRVAFPLVKPPGANFYPPDMDKKVLQHIPTFPISIFRWSISYFIYI